jgi:hypothetical protein
MEILRNILKYTLVLLLITPSFSLAALTYSRSPSGSLPSNPVTVTVQVGAFSEYGLPANTRVYRISLDTDFEGTPIGKCYPVSTLSISETFNLPAGAEIKGVGIDGAVGSADPSDCDTGTTGFKYLEGYGQGTIFMVDGTSNELEMLLQLKIQLLRLQIRILELQIQMLIGQL